ncbi:MAG: hypothetical protein J0L92_32165 [Deltaproteobacteria bacterium]|nr:hypothetical protein [Deltaproteobacteria bacterium]
MLRFSPLALRGVPAGLFIREDGEILLIANESFAISPDGDVLRRRTVFTPDLGLAATSAATFIEGCGVLLAGASSFAWLNPDTLDLGAVNSIPGGYTLVSFTATPRCDVAAIANPVSPTLLLLSPDGETRFAVPTTPSRPPFALADGGFLIVGTDGYDVFASDGTRTQSVSHPIPLSACSTTQAGLSPDGTLFRVCASDDPRDPYVAAIPTGFAPAGNFGPQEGIDFARTNSMGE